MPVLLMQCVLHCIITRVSIELWILIGYIIITNEHTSFLPVGNRYSEPHLWKLILIRRKIKCYKIIYNLLANKNIIKRNRISYLENYENVTGTY